MTIAREDYEKVRTSFAFLYERYWDPALPAGSPQQRAPAVLAQQEQKSMAVARRGLAMAINDTLEMLRDLPLNEVAACDAALKARGGYTLSELRHRYSRQYARLIKRGVIRTDEEYYLAQGIVSDVDFPISEGERDALDAMVHSYGMQKA